MGAAAACHKTVPFLGACVAIGLMIHQYKQLTKKGIVSWDRNQDPVYEHGPIDSGRVAGIIASACFAVFWYIGLIAIIAYIMRG